MSTSQTTTAVQRQETDEKSYIKELESRCQKLEEIADALGDEIQFLGSLARENLNKKTFCFTGKLETLSRDEAKQLVTKCGANFSKDLYGFVEYLVTNDTTKDTKKNRGLAQMKTSGRRHARVLTEKEFLWLMNHH